MIFHKEVHRLTVTHEVMCAVFIVTFITFRSSRVFRTIINVTFKHSPSPNKQLIFPVHVIPQSGRVVEKLNIVKEQRPTFDLSKTERKKGEYK